MLKKCRANVAAERLLSNRVAAGGEYSHATATLRYRTNRTQSMHAAAEAGIRLKPKTGRPGIPSQRAPALHQV
ncbi:MAG: hypothetical protein ACKVII_15515 [Planctomycetales bacterium]